MAIELKARSPRKTIGRFLVEIGSLEPESFLQATRGQVLSTAKLLAQETSWDRAEFESGRLPERDPVELNVSVGDIVLGALRDLSTERLGDLAGILATDAAMVELDSLRHERFSLTNSEEAILDALPENAESLRQTLRGRDDADADVLRIVVAATLATAVTPAVSA